MRFALRISILFLLSFFISFPTNSDAKFLDRFFGPRGGEKRTPKKPAIDKKFPLGKLIGGGGFKDVYEVKDDPSMVIAVFNSPFHLNSLSRELTGLETLRKAGVPTVEVLEHGVTSDGRPAFIMKRYQGSSKLSSRLYPTREDAMTVYKQNFVSKLNKRSAESYRKIIDALKRANLYVDDFQVLMDSDGSLVVADPLNVIHREMPQNSISVLENLLKQSSGN